MPWGARKIEHGRPLGGPIIHSPTASKYCARSSLVTASPSPPSGHNAFSGFEIATPITSADLADDFADRVTGFAIPVMAGLSPRISFPGFSRPRPLHPGRPIVPPL